MEYLLKFIFDKGIIIPLKDVILFALMCTFCLLFNKHKLGLLIVYCFIFYWAFVANITYFMGILVPTTWGLFAYALCGFTMVVLAILSLMHNS